MNSIPDSGYRAFLLRCWPEMVAGPDGEPAWRFALVQAGDEGNGRGFASLEALVAFLRRELRREADRYRFRRDEMKRFDGLSQGGEK